MKGYTATEAAKILNVTRRAVIDWGGRSLVDADVQQSTGRGSRRIYSAANLVQMAVAREAFRHGLTREDVKKLYRKVKKTWPDSGHFFEPEAIPRKDWPMAAWFLFVDGSWYFSLADHTSPMMTIWGKDDVFLKAETILGFNITQIKKEVVSRL